jgi:hypothetical protein
MGFSVESNLAYGFDLHGYEDVWHIVGVQKWEPWVPSWVDVGSAAAIRGDSPDTFDLEEAIRARLLEHDLEGVEVFSYGNVVSDSRPIALAAYRAQSVGTGTVGLHLPDLLNRSEIERWDEALLQALKVLDIQPYQPNPLWLLTQSWG